MGNGSKAVAPIGPCLGAQKVVYTYDKERRIETKVAFELDGHVSTPKNRTIEK